jgi:hypothetical protein
MWPSDLNPSDRDAGSACTVAVLHWLARAAATVEPIAGGGAPGRYSALVEPNCENVARFSN